MVDEHLQQAVLAHIDEHREEIIRFL